MPSVGDNQHDFGRLRRRKERRRRPHRDAEKQDSIVRISILEKTNPTLDVEALLEAKRDAFAPTLSVPPRIEEQYIEPCPAKEDAAIQYLST